jgi:hypothetical protein
VSDRLCGGVFNVLYWQGVRQQLGEEPAVTLRMIDRARP